MQLEEPDEEELARIDEDMRVNAEELEELRGEIRRWKKAGLWVDGSRGVAS